MAPGRQTSREDEADAQPVAVALRYQWPGPETPKGAAPTVVASGQGELARRIIATAAAAGVEVRRDTDLVEVLRRIEVGEQIPPAAFAAVAEILAYLYRLNGTLPDRSGGGAR